MKKSLTRKTTRVMATLMTIAFTSTGAGLLTARAQQSVPEQPDKYTWLEDISRRAQWPG
jgi:hypothetical protein